KGTKSQPKSSGKSIQSEEPDFEVAYSDMPQDQEENPGNDDEESNEKAAYKRGWFTKPKRPQEPTDPDWNDGKTPQQGPTQSWLMTFASSDDKPSKTFDELLSTPTDFSAYIMNGLKITNLTQETLLGPAFKLLKGTRSNYVELEDQRESFYGYARGLESRHDVYSTKRILAVTWVEVMRKHGYGYLREIEVRRVDNDLYTFKEEYLPKRRWSTLEKKRANIMTKAIDKQLKERRIMRSLKKFIGGRHYGTDLQLLQRTI
nr:hypothetical protein [Tanacetum cinerariifolium]